jgi:hypothetical protein
MKTAIVIWLLMTGPTAAEVDAIVESGGSLGTNYFRTQGEFDTERACKVAARKLQKKLHGQHTVWCERVNQEQLG